MNRSENGFSLIELMIVVALVAILVTLSYPSYVNFVRKANRAEAQTTLLDWVNRQEIWRADNPSYSEDINPSNSELYTYSIVTTATTFTMTATALDGQANDQEAGVACTSLTLNQAGTPGPPGHEKCWSK